MTATSCSGSCFRDSAVALAGTVAESALVSLQGVHQQWMRRHPVTDSTNQSESSSVLFEHDRGVPWGSQLSISQAQCSHQFDLMCDCHLIHDHDHRVRFHVRVQNLDHDHDHRDCCHGSHCSQNLVVVWTGFHHIIHPKQWRTVTIRAAVRLRSSKTIAHCDSSCGCPSQVRGGIPPPSRRASMLSCVSRV